MTHLLSRTEWMSAEEARRETESLLSERRVFTIFNDSMYYFDGDKLKYDSEVIYSGWIFFPRVGSYRLPCNEGNFTVS